MSGWAGFSDDELRRMQQGGDAPGTRGRRAAPAGRSRQQMQREKALQLAAQRSAGAAGCPDLAPEQQLAKPPLPLPPAPPPAGREERLPVREEGRAGEEEQSLAVKELEKQEVEVREKSRLELLQQEQKLMEERNKRKKALLAKTIAEKSKQTQAEAVKLKRIQKELQALDDMVSNDIGILRGRIEQSSWDYSAARKRYERAETEYVTAKLELHKKTEVKEQLTEHLCAIIQQNELRKAHKLEELMLQLQLQPTEEELREEKEELKEEKEELKEEKEQQEQQEELKKEETSAPHTLRQEEKNGAAEKLEAPSKDCREESRQEGGGAGQNPAQPKVPPPQVPPPHDGTDQDDVTSCISISS